MTVSSGHFFFDPSFSFPSLCRDVVSWLAWPYGANTVRLPRLRPEKQARAGQARRVCQTVTLRCGSSCGERRTGSVAAWSSLLQRWGLGRGARARAAAGSNRSSPCCFSRSSFQTQGLPGGPHPRLFCWSLKQRQGRSGLRPGLRKPARASRSSCSLAWSLFHPRRKQAWKHRLTWTGGLSQHLGFFFFLMFIYLAAPGPSCSMQDHPCGTWDPVPQPGIELAPALRAQSPSHWTTREVVAAGLLRTMLWRFP